MLLPVRKPVGLLATIATTAVLALVAIPATVSANTVILCGYAGCQFFILGPHTPNPRSSPHIHFKIHPSSVTAGATLHATAKGFLAGEYVTIWDYTGSHWSHASELPGGNANGHGKLAFVRETLANITKATGHKICLQGERSRRVACARYQVKPAGPAVGPGYVPPETESGGYTPPTTGPGYVPPANSQ